MSELNWKHWLVATFVILGLFIQTLKHLQLQGGKAPLMPWDSEVLNTSKQAVPYSVKVAKGNLAPQPTKVSGTSLTREQVEQFVAANTPAATTFEAPTEKGLEGKATPKDDEKCTKDTPPKIDPTTGKPVPCKKKKKKEKKTEEAAAPKTESTPAPPPADSSTIDQVVGTAITTGQVPQPLPDKPDDAFDSIENWRERLGLTHNQPNPDEAKRFIDHYQRGLVTAQIFYQLSEEMLKTPNDDMKNLGVMCLGLNASIVSFQLLADFQKVGPADAPSQVSAKRFLDQYSDMSKLSIVERALRSPSSAYSTVVATQQLDAAARRYLTPKTSPSATPTQLAASQAVLAKNATYFSRFVNILKELEHNSDPTLADKSTNTLRDLQGLLANATPASTSPGNPQQPPVNPPPGGPGSGSNNGNPSAAVNFADPAATEI